MTSYHGISRELVHELIEGEARPPVIARKRDLHEHFSILENQFAGKSRFSFECTKLIVLIRREISLETNYSSFKASLDAEVEHLCTDLDSRWLVSVLDTLADHGTREEQLGALVVIGMLNTLKLCETENLIKRDTSHDPEKLRSVKESFPTPLWDGMINYIIEQGEMPRTTFARIDRSLSALPVIHRIFTELFVRLKEHENPFSRLASYNEAFWKK